MLSPQQYKRMSQETMHNGDETIPVIHAKDALEMDDPHGASPPPDGGFQAWTVVAGSFLCLFVSFGWVNCEEDAAIQRYSEHANRIVGIGLFQTYYETHQLKNYSASTIAWITSFEVFIMFLGVCTPYSLPT